MQSPVAVLLERESQPAAVQKTSTVQKTSKREMLKRTGARYWKQLMRVGVPQDDARDIAIAVVRYSHLHCHPSFQEKRLIGRYCQHLCAVGLWRLEMLLGS